MIIKEYKWQDWFAMFGNGDMAHIQAYSKYQKDNGEFWVQFFFSSNDQDLIDKYELKVGEEISEETGMIEMHYPATYVSFLLVSTEVTRVLIKLDLIGNQTELSMGDMAISERMRLYEKQLRIMNIHNHQLEQDMERIMNRQEEQMKRQKRMYDSVRDKKEDESVTNTEK
jgi:hypothetical protein